MTPDEILSEPARVLSQAQREFYFENGYICVEGLIGKDLLGQLRNVTSEFIEKSRGVRKAMTCLI